MKRFHDDERPDGCCYDCGLRYASPAWIDANVPAAVWEKINPTYHRGAGLLCINCMAKRCAEAGLENVPLKLASGPFINFDPARDERNFNRRSDDGLVSLIEKIRRA